MLPSVVRRAALLALAGLLAALLAVVHAPAAQASASCTSEKPGLLGLTCDDERPPATASASGQQTAAGQVTVTATASYDDGDTDAIGLECRLGGTSIWGPCVISNLAVGTYQVAIRAVDMPDNALTTPCDNPAPIICGRPETPDYDASPALVSVQVTGGGGGGDNPDPPPGPNGDPETQISGGPHDKLTPGAPVTLRRRIVVDLASSEPARYHCAINATKVACHDGTNVLKRLKPGPQVFVAQAVDKEGHFDATPASLTFYVPANLSPRHGKGWTKVTSGGSFAGDYVATSRKGAVLSFGPVQGIRELRLVAPIGPRLGTIAIRIGTGDWQKVDLGSKEARKLKVFEVRPPGSARVSGTIRIKALKVPAGGAVAVDAIVAR